MPGGGGGGDDKNPGKPSPARIDVKDGTWRVITRTESTGDEQCASPAETDTADVVQCDQDLGLGGETGFSTNCDVTPNGQNFTFACSGEASFPPCTINFNISGSGHQALDNYELNGSLILSTGGASTTFASLPCTTTIHETGRWLNANGTCGEGAPNDIFLKSLVSRSLR